MDQDLPNNVRPSCEPAIHNDESSSKSHSSFITTTTRVPHPAFTYNNSPSLSNPSSASSLLLLSPSLDAICTHLEAKIDMVANRLCLKIDALHALIATTTANQQNHAVMNLVAAEAFSRYLPVFMAQIPSMQQPPIAHQNRTAYMEAQGGHHHPAYQPFAQQPPGSSSLANLPFPNSSNNATSLSTSFPSGGNNSRGVLALSFSSQLNTAFEGEPQSMSAVDRTPPPHVCPASPPMSSPPFLSATTGGSFEVKNENNKPSTSSSSNNNDAAEEQLSASFARGHVFRKDKSLRSTGSGFRQRRCARCVYMLRQSGTEAKRCWSNARKTSFFCETCPGHPPMCSSCFIQHKPGDC